MKLARSVLVLALLAFIFQPGSGSAASFCPIGEATDSFPFFAADYFGIDTITIFATEEVRSSTFLDEDSLSGSVTN